MLELSQPSYNHEAISKKSQNAEDGGAERGNKYDFSIINLSCWKC